MSSPIKEKWFARWLIVQLIEMFLEFMVEHLVL